MKIRYAASAILMASVIFSGGWGGDPKAAYVGEWSAMAPNHDRPRKTLSILLLSSQGALAADVGDILRDIFRQRPPTSLRRQASPRERSAQERQASWQAREVIESRIPQEIRSKYEVTDAVYTPGQQGRVVANDLLELPPFSRARVALRTYCLDRPLPAPTSGEKLHVIEVDKLLSQEFIPIYESLMSYSALHPEKNLQIQRIVWVMRFLSEGLDIPAFDMVPEDRRLLEEIHPGSVGVIENRRRRIRLQREISKIIDVLLDQALPPEVRGVLRELSSFGYDMNRPPRDLRTADDLVARTLEIINAMRPTGPILEDNSEYTLLSNDIAVKTEHPGGASRTSLILANPTPETKTVDFKRYALQSGRDTQRLGIGGIDSVEWPDAPAGNLQLPWQAGDVWKVTQGYHEHQPGSREDDCYAIDFAPLPGQSKSVYAMRGGKAVARVGQENAKRPDWCPSYAKWNPPLRRVVVTHDDGTKAEYCHLDSISPRLLDDKGNPLPNGVEIKQGEYLGEMGSSGCASGPHLHIILRSSDDKVVRIPGFKGTIIFSPLEARMNTSPIVEDTSKGRGGGCANEGEGYRGYIQDEEYLSQNEVR